MHLGLATQRSSSGRAPGLGVALGGMFLIASTYGMARFGVGLYAPRLVLERPALAPVVGQAAAAQFLSYALAAAVAGRLTHQRLRTALVLAGATATVGCIGVAVASTPAGFVAAVFVGGMGAGFASPAVVCLIDAVVPDGAAATSQSTANSGTAVGVVVAGVLAFATTSTSPVWLLMAMVCNASAGAVLLLTHRRAGSVTHPGARHASWKAPTGLDWGRLVAPGTAALAVGAGSSLIWTFGPLLATQEGPVEPGQVGWLWIALGLGGLLGPVTGAVVDRWGLRRGWRLFVGVLTVANFALLAAVVLPATWLAFAGMAVFGTGYMCLSGVLILWARSVWPSAAGAGTSALFIALAVGQAIGSAGFGLAQRHLAPTLVILAAAALCATGGALTRRNRPLESGLRDPADRRN